MRVLINCLSSRSGGAVAYLRNLLPLLATELSGRNTELVTLARSDQQSLVPGALPGSDRILVPPEQVEGIRRLIWERRHLATTTRKSGTQVVFTPYQIGTHVERVCNVGMLRNMEPFFAGNYPYSLRSRVRNHVLRLQTGHFLRQSDAVIAVSEYVADYARTALAIQPDRIARIYHGRDPKFSEDAADRDQATLDHLGIREPYVFSCGSLLPYRRFEDVIGGFSSFVAGRPDHPVLVIAGSGTDSLYRNHIVSLTKTSPISDQIRYLGQVDQDTMAALYRRSRVFVTSTEIEACPNIALEALSAGCRIVAADIPVLREVFSSAATFYPARQIAALRSEIERAWTDEAGSEALRITALNRSEAFSWQECARQTADLLVRVQPDDKAA